MRSMEWTLEFNYLLSAKDPRSKAEVSPLVKAISCYRVPKPLDRNTLNMATRWCIESMKRESVPFARVLTESEAINGIEGQPYLDSLDMSTSPGFHHLPERPKGSIGREFLFEGSPGSWRVSNEVLVS